MILLLLPNVPISPARSRIIFAHCAKSHLKDGRITHDTTDAALINPNSLSIVIRTMMKMMVFLLIPMNHHHLKLMANSLMK